MCESVEDIICYCNNESPRSIILAGVPQWMSKEELGILLVWDMCILSGCLMNPPGTVELSTHELAQASVHKLCLMYSF